MKINEIEPQLKLFEAIKQRAPTLKLFSVVDSDILDLYYLNKYGERSAARVVIKNPVETVANMLCGIYSKKWDSLFDTTQSLQNMYASVSKKETVTYDETGTNNNTSTNTTQVSGYDSDVFVDDNKDTNTSEGNTTNNYTKTTTTDNPFVNYNSVVEFMESNPFIETVFNDVNSFITLKIFDFDLY